VQGGRRWRVEEGQGVGIGRKQLIVRKAVQQPLGELVVSAGLHLPAGDRANQ
jgi:hypothetical protein